MSDGNAYARFLKLIPDRRRSLATVVSDQGDGTSLVESPSGSQYVVTGDGHAVNDTVIVQGGRIVGKAAGGTTFTTVV